MDTVTHVLLGAVCAVAVSTKPSWNNSDLRPRLVIAAVGAAFPDIDYLSFWIHPLLFLADWHRTYTHSLLLLPVWAGLIWTIAMLWNSARRQPTMIFLFCCLGLLSHICLDLLTVYGVRVLFPASEVQYSVGIVFVIDGIVTTVLATSLVLFFFRSCKNCAVISLGLLLVYFSGLWGLQNQARQIAGEQLIQYNRIHALPQPFSPFYWQLIGQSGSNYRVAYLNLLSDDIALISAYRGSGSLDWKSLGLFGSPQQESQIIKEAWSQPKFQKFREFAGIPVFYRMDRGVEVECVWFTDLRYVLPYLTPSFRYGMCREYGRTWALYRLKRFTIDERQSLNTSTITNLNK